MNREQLENLSKDNNVKFSKKTSDEDLIFGILDAEARAESQKPIPDKPKRGRPRKVKAETAEAPKEAPKAAAKAPESPKSAKTPKVAEAPTKEAEPTEKPKRGRPRKAKAEQPADEKPSVAAPVQGDLFG